MRRLTKKFIRMTMNRKSSMKVFFSDHRIDLYNAGLSKDVNIGLFKIYKITGQEF